jgi:outer membrane protein TolC
MSKKCLFIAAICWSLCATSHGAEQGKVSLNIRQVLDLVEQNNKDVVAARRNVMVSEQGVKVANAAKLPDISAAVSVNYLGDITITDRDFSNAYKAPMPHLGNSLELSVYQPVYTGGALTAGVDIAKSQIGLSENRLEQTRQGVGIRAIGCFLELFKAYNLKTVYEENIAMTTKLLDEMKARYAEGVVLKNDITRYELRLSSLNYDLLTINNRIKTMNHDLCILLGLDPSTEIATSIEDDLNCLPDKGGEASWFNTTLTNSTELKALDLQQTLNDQQRRLLKAERLPKIGLVAGDKFSGPIDFEIPVINNNYNFWYFGINIKYNFSSLFKTSKSLLKNSFEGNEIATRREAAVDRLSTVINDTYTQYEQAFKMLETEEKNVELATENYRVVENRYNNQLALLTDMLDASTSKLDADVRLVNARVNIIYYYYQLKYNSGTL